LFAADQYLCTAAELAEYEAKVEALDDTLAWLAGGAARIKAALADAGGNAAAAANSWHVPHGLLPPLQDKTSIGKVRRECGFLLD
jgi:hypothetical protein